MDATAFCSNHVWKRWFWPQELSINAPRFESAFWNAVYSKSAFWNTVYSKISMDATAFCSNHVWKRWFWPQKLSINAPLEENCFSINLFGIQHFGAFTRKSSYHCINFDTLGNGIHAGAWNIEFLLRGLGYFYFFYFLLLPFSIW